MVILKIFNDYDKLKSIKERKPYGSKVDFLVDRMTRGDYMKRDNKGFSLVELIIVIAIMAILAGAIAPALIRYIDKSRKSNDVSAAKTIKTAVETALSYEKTFELLTTGDTTTTTDADGNSISYAGYIEITPNIPDNGYGNNGILIVQANGADTDAAALQSTSEEIANNLGEQTPRIKYKRAANGSITPTKYYAFCSTKGSIYVGVGTGVGNGQFYQLAPSVSKYYQ